MLMNTTFLGDSFFIKWQSRDGIDLVLGELERCGGQFHLILREI